VKTLDETAALLDAFDVVLSVTTASAHIAGALGKQVWVMVPTLPTWRYMWQGERTPWYPSMRIFRGRGEQPAESLVAEVREALAGRLRG
jgi:ADP-heptose:LPS heptosyltransferase